MKLHFPLLVVALGLSCCGNSAADERPNILLVVADDLGWTDLGSFGSEISTPNLDQLAKQGILFTDFHVSVSCSPTRAMLLTGQDNHVAGLGSMAEFLTSNQQGQPGYEGHLNDRVVTLAEVLRSSGYHTYMAGKWHLGTAEGQMPFDRGFERSFSLLTAAASNFSSMHGIMPGNDPAIFSRNGKYLKELPADHYSSRSYADDLMDSIRANRGDGKPFLAYLAFQAVHDPIQVPEPWLSKYRGAYDEGYEALRQRRWESARKLGLVPEDAKLTEQHPLIKPWNELSEDEKQREIRGMEVYAGMLEAMDYHYGRVADFLKDIGENENTIIVFLSDNGANPWYATEYPEADNPEFTGQFDNRFENIGHPGSNYAYGIGFASSSSGPLNLFKFTVSEGGIRSPLLIAGPGIQGGRRSDAFAYVTDLMPTLLEMATAQYPAEFEGRKIEPLRGRSLRALLDGSQEAIYGSDDFVGGEMFGGKWIRRDNLKALMVPKPYGSGQWRLHDLSKDPGEVNDLSQQMPNELETLVAAWEKYAKEVGVILAE